MIDFSVQTARRQDSNPAIDALAKALNNLGGQVSANCSARSVWAQLLRDGFVIRRLHDERIAAPHDPGQPAAA